MTGLYVIGFGLLFLAASVWFNGIGRIDVDKLFASQTFGPIETRRLDENLTITLTQIPTEHSWSYVEATLTTEDGKALLSFGDEFFHEPSTIEGVPARISGVSDVSLSMPKPGKYFLKFWVTGGVSGDLVEQDLTSSAIIGVRVDYHNGEPWYLRSAGWALLVVGLTLVLAGCGSTGTARRRMPAYTAVGLSFLFALLVLPSLGWFPYSRVIDIRPEVHASEASIYNDTPSLRAASLGGPSHMGGALMAGK